MYLILYASKKLRVEITCAGSRELKISSKRSRAEKAARAGHDHSFVMYALGVACM